MEKQQKTWERIKDIFDTLTDPFESVESFCEYYLDTPDFKAYPKSICEASHRDTFYTQVGEVGGVYFSVLWCEPTGSYGSVGGGNSYNTILRVKKVEEVKVSFEPWED